MCESVFKSNHLETNLLRYILLYSEILFTSTVVSIMACNDFLHWDFDIDLEALLGDYTCSEDDNISGKEKTSKKSVQKDGKYMCTECEKTYSSISGIRGHMTSKHGYTSVRGKKSFVRFKRYYASHDHHGVLATL